MPETGRATRRRARDPLAPYRSKRDFGRTPEPADRPAARRPGLSFVVQRHAARRLHYDFRLELNGVLKSWAVPKGPSANPAVKRLAVQVEDHPVAYGGFEGRIPQGEYGAGEVRLWDRGTWRPEGDAAAGLRKGRLDFELSGKRLHGRWMLVRLRKSEPGKPAWLLIKARDEHATASTVDAAVADDAPARVGLPRRIEPQLATPVATPPSQGRWYLEMKLDGYRLLARCQGASVHLYSRNGLDWSRKLPHIATALARLQLRDSWLDGELVATDTRGQPQFQLLQERLDRDDDATLRYHVFDLLFADGVDLRPRPLQERRPLLQRALSGLRRPEPVRLVEQVEGGTAALFEQVCRERLEGLILKDAAAPYRSGRNRAWLKLKCRREQEFVIGGFTRTAAGRGTLTSLLLGRREDATHALRFAGRAGTGFGAQALADLRRRLDRLAQDTCPFEPQPRLRAVERPTWVKPTLAAQVRYAGWTRAGLLRQPAFVGLRRDKVGRAVEATPEPVAATRKRGRAKLTHPERVVFPDDGVAKGELANYYDGVQAALWPQLRKRPLSIVRATDQGGVFFQRHLQSGPLPGLKSLPRQESGELPFFTCAAPAGLLSLAQLAAVELHTWSSSQPRLARADRLTFDLDPDAALAWPAVRDAAVMLRDLLGELGLRSFLKTTGGKGLHVVVPLATPLPDWERAAAFSRAVAVHLARVLPNRFTARAGARNREGRIYVDFQRNRRGATAVAAWSPRARPGVPVSMPLAWEALGSTDLRGAHFNLRNALAHLVDRSADPWAAYSRLRQRLTTPMLARFQT